MNIYKIIIGEAGTLESFVDSTIFCDMNVAVMFAKELFNEGEYEGHEISSVDVYREYDDKVHGIYRTDKRVAHYEKAAK